MECTEVLNHRQQDLAALTQEHAILAQSERQLRTERSRVQAELALYRERVREMDDERRRVFKAVQTRGALADAAFQRCLNDSEGGSSGASAGPGTGSGSGSGMFQGTGLLAGPAGAAYVRSEDLHSGSEQLEAALSELQDELLHHQPSLLPMLRRVGEELHEDRVKFLTVQARLLTVIESVQGQGRAQARPAQDQGPRLNAGVGLGPATNVFSSAGTGGGTGAVTGVGPNAGLLLAGVTGMVDPGPGSWPQRRKRETYRKPVVMEEPKNFVF